MPGTKEWVLYRGPDKIGHYDKAGDVYRRVHTDGTLSDPAPRPWRTNPGVVPRPGAVAAKPAAPKPAAPPPADPGAAAEKTSGGPLAAVLRTAPPWTLYAAGGGLAGLAVLCGLMAHGRRQ